MAGKLTELFVDNPVSSLTGEELVEVTQDPNGTPVSGAATVDTIASFATGTNVLRGLNLGAHVFFFTNQGTTAETNLFAPYTLAANTLVNTSVYEFALSGDMTNETTTVTPLTSTIRIYMGAVLWLELPMTLPAAAGAKPFKVAVTGSVVDYFGLRMTGQGLLSVGEQPTKTIKTDTSTLPLTADMDITVTVQHDSQTATAADKAVNVWVAALQYFTPV